MRACSGSRAGSPGEQRQLAVQRDDAADVVGIAVAEAREHFIVDRVELPARCASICSSLSRASGLSIIGCVISGLSLESSVTGRRRRQLTQVRISVPAIVTSPVLRSRTEPLAQPAGTGVADAHPASEGKLDPAPSPATRIGVAPSQLADTPVLEKLNLTALADDRRQHEMFEGLHVQPLSNPGVSEVGGERTPASPRARTHRSRAHANRGRGRRGAPAVRDRLRS